jgi:signal transduction histidine kinase
MRRVDDSKPSADPDDARYADEEAERPSGRVPIVGGGGRRSMRTSQVPTGQYDRNALQGRLVMPQALEGPTADDTLAAAVELVHAIRPDMDDDGIVQSFIAGLCALLPGRRFVVRLLPSPPEEPHGTMWVTGPILEGSAERLCIDRAALTRYGFYAEDAERAGFDLSDGYISEFHRAAQGFHIPIFCGRALLGSLSTEYFPGTAPPSGDAVATGQLAIQLGAALAQRRVRSDSAKLEEQIVQAEKLATLGQLAAGVVHELNNPLTSISAYGEYLHAKHSQRGGDPGDVEKLQRIVQGADRIQRFTRDLVTYARPSTEPAQELGLREVVAQAVVFCEHIVREVGAEVHVEAEPPLPTVSGVRGQLHQVLINLLTNACHAMPEGAGRLFVRMRSTSTGRVELRVEDNGAGIPEHLHEAIFQPFFSTKGQGKGTGLGLSIVRNIVQHHGGTIRVESVLGQGAVFVVTLPAWSALSAR